MVPTACSLAVSVGVAALLTAPGAWAQPATNGDADGASTEPAQADAGAAEVQPPAADGSPRALVLPVQLSGRKWKGAEALRHGLDEELNDTAQDLGLLVDVAEGPAGDRAVEETDLTELARTTQQIVVWPFVKLGADAREPLELRIAVARPGERNLAVRVERVPPADANVRAAVMLRDLVSELLTGSMPKKVGAPAAATPDTPMRSPGRAVLAANGTALGAFIGYSIQRTARSDDPRLLFPLLGVGAGVGLGSAIIISDEWDVGVGEAWYLAAGAWWPAAAGHLIYAGRFTDRPNADPDEEWSFGLVPGTRGRGGAPATVGMLPHGISEGSATLTHSGGGLGLLLGGLVEMGTTGNIGHVPLGGMGYGAALGWLAGAATAIQVDPSSMRVLTIDLGLLLGGLAGASAASPLLFEEPTQAQVRGWVGAAGAGMVAGGLLAGFLSEPSDDEPSMDNDAPAAVVAHADLPHPAVIATDARGAPVLGVSAGGVLW